METSGRGWWSATSEGSSLCAGARSIREARAGGARCRGTQLEGWSHGGTDREARRRPLPNQVVPGARRERQAPLRLADDPRHATAGRACSSASLRQRTRRDYLDQLERHVLPKLGHLRLDQIHTARTEAEVVAPLREAGHLRTARLAVSALSRVYRAALKDPTYGLMGNPCLGVEIGKQPRAAVHPLTAEERRRFRVAIQGTPFESLWLLMLLTGLGPGEALGLGWQQVDLDAGELRVVRTLDCKARVLVDDTKRASRRRSVPLVPEVRATLRKRWLAAGRPVPELMGHSSPRTTQDTYQHVSNERKREAAEGIRGRLL